MTSFHYSDTVHALLFAVDSAKKKEEKWATVPVDLLEGAANEIKQLQALNASLERQKLDLLIERATPWPGQNPNP